MFTSLAESSLKGQRSKIGSVFHVWSITLSFLDGFGNYFAEMLTIIELCARHKTQVCSFKVKVTLRGQKSKVGSIFSVWSITLSFFDGFRNYFAVMLSIMRRCVARKTGSVVPRSRSHLEVKSKICLSHKLMSVTHVI